LLRREVLRPSGELEQIHGKIVIFMGAGAVIAWRNFMLVLEGRLPRARCANDEALNLSIRSQQSKRLLAVIILERALVCRQMRVGAMFTKHMQVSVHFDESEVLGVEHEPNECSREEGTIFGDIVY
jgi:hypothetical protein